MTGLSDFLIKDKNGYSTFELEKLKKLSIEKFAEIYKEKMSEFMKNHLGLLNCYPCSKPVEKADDLVRYFGMNLHRNCFLKEYQDDFLELTPRQRQYFGLVKRMIKVNDAFKIN